MWSLWVNHQKNKKKCKITNEQAKNGIVKYLIQEKARKERKVDIKQKK